MTKIKSIHIDDIEITILAQESTDYISLTDMARSQLQDVVIIKWLSLKSTIEYLGEWESLYNPNFNYTEFGTIKNAAGSNNFVLSVKQWIAATNAIGIISKAGRYGGTFAHKDTIKENIIPALISKSQINFIYAGEADLLNVALFGMTAKQWKEANPKTKGNMRDEASIEQLVVLSNMESINALLIEQGLLQKERLVQLNKVAISQMKSLSSNGNITSLGS
jgi:hypothetical protein